MVLVVICLIYNTEYMLIQTPHVTPSPSPLVAMRLFSASAGLFLQQLFKCGRPRLGKGGFQARSFPSSVFVWPVKQDGFPMFKALRATAAARRRPLARGLPRPAAPEAARSGPSRKRPAAGGLVGTRGLYARCGGPGPARTPRSAAGR